MAGVGQCAPTSPLKGREALKRLRTNQIISALGHLKQIFFTVNNILTSHPYKAAKLSIFKSFDETILEINLHSSFVT